MKFHHCCVPLENILLATPGKIHYFPPGKNPSGAHGLAYFLESQCFRGKDFFLQVATAMFRKLDCASNVCVPASVTLARGSRITLFLLVLIGLRVLQSLANLC